MEPSDHGGPDSWFDETEVAYDHVEPDQPDEYDDYSDED